MRGLAAAYSLIELLVVVAIMSLIYGMILVIPEDTVHDRLQAASHELKATLMQARSMAMRSNEVHAVTFHIQNASNGHVFKNRSIYENSGEREGAGGHWYAIIGPDKTGNTNSRSYIPMFDRDYDDSNRAKLYRTLNDFIDGMQESQVGEKHYLPEGVRFLALSDLDEGHRHILDYQTWRSGGCGPTFPRPWYGYYDAGRLHAWGGFDPVLDDSYLPDYPISGLCFEGHDAGQFAYDVDEDAIINTGAIYGRIDTFNLAKNNTNAQSRTNAYTGQPRAVVNAYWGDAMILFMPDGHAYFASAYARIKMFEYAGSNNNRIISRAGMRISHLDTTTGGYHVTLARDVDPEDELYRDDDAETGQKAYHLFADEEDALNSIRPFLRVFVHKDTGEVSIKDESHPHCLIQASDMGSKDPYPGL